MNTKKKRGLGHGLNEILPNHKLSEQRAKTKQILSQFQKPKDQIEETDLDQIKIPITDTNLENIDQIQVLDTSIQQTLVSENTVFQQIPVSNNTQHSTNTKPNTSIQQTPVSNNAQYIEPTSQYFKIPNVVADELLSSLDPYEFKVYFRLFRLSHGFHQSQCFVGYNGLSQACQLSIAQIKRVIPSLIKKKLIKVIQYFNSATKKGTVYEVYTSIQQIPVSNSNESIIDTSISQTSNKRDDDPLKKHDHHQSTMLNATDHEKQVMMIYQEVTNNIWSKADHTNYEKIKHIPIEKIEVALRLAYDRASNRPNSFAFFIKEILSSLNPKTQSRTNRKKALAKIVERVRNASVGSNVSPSEFAYKVKELCLMEDVAFDNDLLDELMNKA